MTEDSNLQAPDETQDAAKGGDTGTDSIDDILKSYAEESRKSQPETQQKPPAEADQALALLKSLGISAEDIKAAVAISKKTEAKNQETEFDSGLQKSVDIMREHQPDLDEVPDWILSGKLWDASHKDKRLAEAFANRDSDPDKWSKVLEKLSKEVSKDLSGGDSKRGKAVRNAVRLGTATISQTDDHAESERVANLPTGKFFEEMRRLGQV